MTKHTCKNNLAELAKDIEISIKLNLIDRAREQLIECYDFYKQNNENDKMNALLLLGYSLNNKNIINKIVNSNPTNHLYYSTSKNKFYLHTSDSTFSYFSRYYLDEENHNKYIQNGGNIQLYNLIHNKVNHKISKYKHKINLIYDL